MPTPDDAQADLEALLLGAPCELDREEVSALAGVPEAEARAVWVALGFPEVAAGEKAFTRLDAAALKNCLALQDSGVVDNATLLILARAMGQGLSRLAEAQVDAFRRVASTLPLEEVVAATTESASTVVPRLQELMVHVWRRQLAASTSRSLAAIGHDGLPVLVVGFIDLVGFTSRSREWSAIDLERTLERFERDTAQRVTARGGRVIKTLGDEIMWVCDDAAAAAEVALATVEAHEGDDLLPPVRAGLARGGVVQRLGDVFGEPVNLASRLTSEARPGAVLIDRELAEALEGQPAFELVRLHQRSVRGYQALRPHLLRRSSSDHRTTRPHRSPG